MVSRFLANVLLGLRSFRPTRQMLLLGASLFLAGGAGVLASTAIGAGASSAGATRTITVSLENGGQGTPGPVGPAGARGPAGPAGEPGAASCPSGFDPTVLVINHPHGHVTIFTCLLSPTTTSG